jgi:hypothetical protein
MRGRTTRTRGWFMNMHVGNGATPSVEILEMGNGKHELRVLLEQGPHEEEFINVGFSIFSRVRADDFGEKPSPPAYTGFAMRFNPNHHIPNDFQEVEDFIWEVHRLGLTFTLGDKILSMARGLHIPPQ